MNILLVQTSFLGDTVLSTAVIAAIHRKFPEAKIWMMTTSLSKALVENDPLLAGVIVFDKRKEESGLSGLLRKAAELRTYNFNRVYSLHRSFRTSLLLFLARIPFRIGFKKTRLSWLYHRLVERPKQQHDVIRNLAIMQDEDSPDITAVLINYASELRLFLPSDYKLSPNLIKTESLQGYIVLVPGSAWATKRWSQQEYRKVAQHFLAIGKKVLILGATEEKEICNQVAKDLDVLDLSGQTTILDLMFLVKNAQLLVCNDSMSLHIASAFKTPTVAVFCATSPKFGFGPWKNKALVVEKSELPCKPCRRHGGNTCPTGTEACMRELPASAVITAAESLIGKVRQDIGSLVK